MDVIIKQTVRIEKYESGRRMFIPNPMLTISSIYKKIFVKNGGHYDWKKYKFMGCA